MLEMSQNQDGNNLWEQEENTEHLLCASHCTRCFSYFSFEKMSCDLYNSTEK